MAKLRLERVCYICGQMKITNRRTMKICGDKLCSIQHQKNRRCSQQKRYRAEKESAAAVPKGDNGAIPRPWGEPSWFSLLVEIDGEGMTVDQYARFFRRYPAEVHHNLKIARRLGYAGLDEIRNKTTLNFQGRWE